MRPKNDPHPPTCEILLCTAPALYKLTFPPGDDLSYFCGLHRHYWRNRADYGQIAVAEPLARPSRLRRLVRKLDYAFIVFSVMVGLSIAAHGAIHGLQAGATYLLFGIGMYLAGRARGRRSVT